MSDKEIILDTVENIDDKSSFEEILYTLYMQFEIQKGIKDMENGKVKTTDEVRKIINGNMD